MTYQTATLIIGANSEIAKALAEQVSQQPDTQLIVVSRNVEFYFQPHFSAINAIQVNDYEETTLQQTVQSIKMQLKCPITQVFICHGILHGESLFPEKRLAELTEQHFLNVIKANTLTPILWLKQLQRLLKSHVACHVVIFTARVGSISENELGGWYSYRTSKAAMNMLIKSTAIEFKRSAKNIKLISFHPGTTDTPLSKPFQKNVPKGKLFSSEFVATQLLTIVENTAVDGEASFVDWKGEQISW